MWRVIMLFSILVFISCKEKKETKIDKIVDGKKLKVGVAFLDFTNGQSFSILGDSLFPLQSVFKFHVAAKVLDEVDKGSLNLNQSILIKKEDLANSMYSPLRDEIGIDSKKIRLDSLIYFMVAHSDNVACDVLLNQVGGAKEVERFFEKLKIKDTHIALNEAEMHLNWENQYKNLGSPNAVLEALKRFYLREYLSGDSHNFLYAMMSNTHTGKNRIKAGLPEGATIAHKTGSSGRNKDGMSSATNDAAIITLKDGRSFILVIFITDSYESDEVNEKVIAEITKSLLS